MSQIDDAIIQWRKCAERERERIRLGLTYGDDRTALYNADLYERTARSLEVERDTGIAVCGSCFKPYNFDKRGHHSCVG